MTQPLYSESTQTDPDQHDLLPTYNHSEAYFKPMGSYLGRQLYILIRLEKSKYEGSCFR